MTMPARSATWTRYARRWAPPLAIAAVVLTMLPGSAAPEVTTVAAALPEAVTSVVPRPAACKPNPNPPPTEYGFVARVTDGTVTGEGPLSVTEIDVSVCGVVRLVAASSGGCTGVQGRLIIPADGVITNSLKADFSIAGLPAMENVPTEVIAEPMSSDISCDDSDDGLTMDLRLRVSGSAGVFGLQCRVPFTGEVRATVTGPLLTPPYRAQAVITGAVQAGAVSNNDKFCPGRLPERVNRVAGLPDAGYQVDWPVEVSIYQP